MDVKRLLHLTAIATGIVAVAGARRNQLVDTRFGQLDGETVSREQGEELAMNFQTVGAKAATRAWLTESRLEKIM